MSVFENAHPYGCYCTECRETIFQQAEEVLKFSAPKKAVADRSGDADIDEMLQDCLRTLELKGAEYTVGSVDRLANFRGVATDVGIPMEKAWFVFFNKHLRAVQSYIKNGCEVKSDEPIWGRVMDCIVYLLLFAKMTREIETRKKSPEGG